MNKYHYCVLSKAEAPHFVGAGESIDMENVDYKRQPDAGLARTFVDTAGGLCCGIIHGGMFGLATNQIAMLSAWQDGDEIAQGLDRLARQNHWEISDEVELLATVRPVHSEKLERPGIYVIRWIRMLETDIEEYTRLCVETWPAFETTAQARCFGVFRPLEDTMPVTLLMLTWYASLTDWEQSRRLQPADANKWARRSEMELSHWAQAGRLALA